MQYCTTLPDTVSASHLLQEILDMFTTSMQLEYQPHLSRLGILLIIHYTTLSPDQLEKCVFIATDHTTLHTALHYAHIQKLWIFFTISLLV